MTKSNAKPLSVAKAYALSYFALFLISLAAMASYFAYDCIGPLTPLLKEKLNLSATQVYWLYSIYSVPVIIFVVFGGLLADKLGVKKASIVFAAFFGLPWMAENFTLGDALWLVAAINVLGVLATLLYIIIDRYGEKKKIVSFVEEDDETFDLRTALKLPLAFWVISLLCVTYYSAIFPFQACATDFFTERYGLDNIAAGRLAGTLILISMCFTWVFGAIVDRFGRRATIMIIGSIAMIPCHISMAYTDINPWIPMVILGLSFSLVPASLWPALPLIVKENQLGTAYGVIAMVQNVGLFLFPLAAGAIRDSTGTYNLAMVMFAGLGVLGLIFAIWLKIVEAKGGHYLEKVI